MIILVTLMVAASLVLSIPIDDVPDSSYVPIDPSAPVRIDPATIIRLFREQSPYPVSSPPFNEGFYYTVPARLLLYQPPPGQSYQASRSVKEHGNCDNQHNPITVGEYVQSAQRQFKRLDAQAGISSEVLPPSNVPGGGTQYANYYDRSSDYQNLKPSSSATSQLSGNGEQLVMRSYPSQNYVHGTPGNSQQLYSQKIPVPNAEYKQGVSSNLQDHQNVLVAQSADDVHYRLQNSWPQSSGPANIPEVDYDISSSQYLFGKTPSETHPSLNNGLRFPLHEDLNTQRYGGSNHHDGPYTTVFQPDGRVSSGPEYLDYRNSRTPVFTSQYESMDHHRGGITNYYNGHSSSDASFPQSQIPPSYLVGLKLLTRVPSSSVQSSPVWELPDFPKHTAEPWASKMYAGSSYSADRYGFQSRPIDSSRSGARDLGATTFTGLRPPFRDGLHGRESRTPWVVLLVPPDSLFRKDYNIGMKTPWFSSRTYGTNGNALATNQAGIPLCQKENFNVAESQYPISDGLETSSLVKGSSPLEEPAEVGSARSLLTQPTIKSQDQQQPVSQVIQAQTIMTGGNIVPSTVKQYTTTTSSGSQHLIEDTRKDLVTATVAGNQASSATVTQPRGEVHTVVEEVMIRDPLTQHVITSSQPLVGQSTGMRYANMEGSGSEGERLQVESMVTGKVATPIINNAGTKQLVEEGGDSGFILSGTTFIEGARTDLTKSENKDVSRVSNLDHIMTVGGENVVQSTDIQKGHEHIDSLWSTQVASSGSNIHIGMEQDTVNSTNNVVDRSEGSSAMINYTKSSGLAAQQIINQENGPDSATIVLSEAPPTSKIVQYVTAGGAVQENLGEGETELNIGSSRYSSSGSTGTHMEVGDAPQIKTTLIEERNSPSQVIQYVSEGRADTQQILEGPEIRTAEVEGNGSLSKMIRYVINNLSGTDGLVNNSTVGQKEYSTLSGYNYSGDTGHQELKEQANTLGSTTTYTSVAPSTSNIIHYVTSGGTDGVNLGGGNIALQNRESSAVTQYTTSGSSGTQQIIEDGHAPQITISTLVNGGNSQIIRNVTEGNTGALVVDVASGHEGHSTIEKHNYTAINAPQQAEGIGSTTTTVMGGAPSTSKIIHYSTSGVTENLGEDKIGLGDGGLFTETHYIASGNTGTEQITDGGHALQTISTLVNGGNSDSQVIHYLTDGNTSAPGGDIASKNEGHSMIAQYNYTDINGSQQGEGSSSTKTILGEAPTVKIIPYETSHGALGENGDGKIAVGNKGSSIVTPYITTDSSDTRQNAEKGLDSQTMSIVVGGENSTSQVVHNVTEGSITPQFGRIASGSEGHSVVEKYSYTGGVGPQQVVQQQANGLESTTTILSGAPSTTKIIRYVTSEATEGENLGETKMAIENEGPSTETRYITPGSPGIQQRIEQPNSLQSKTTTTTILGRAPLTKIIRYVTTGGEVQGSSTAESVEILPVTQIIKSSNQVIEGSSSVQSGLSQVEGAPSSAQVIRYVTNGGTGSGLQDYKTLRNEGNPVITTHYNNTDISGVQQVADQSNHIGSTTTVVDGAPSSSSIIRYVKMDGIGEEQHQGSNVEFAPSTSTQTQYMTSGSRDSVPTTTTTFVKGAPATTKIIRYIITADGEERQEIVDESSLALENGGASSVTVTNPAVSTSKIIRYAGSQHVNTSPELKTTIENGSPATNKTISFMINGGAETQQVIGTSNNNQPTQTITHRYITMPGTGKTSSGQTNLQQGGSTVTRYITMPGSAGATSQFLSGQGNLQSSKTIVAGNPSTMTRFSLTYPQASGMGGTRYTHGFQTQTTSTVMKPASHVSGAQSSRSYVMSPESTVVTKTN